MTGADFQYELVRATADGTVVHARQRKAYGQQYATACGNGDKVRLVMVDPFTTLYAQVTCTRCRRILDGER